MKKSMSSGEVADALLRDDNASWTYAGARALAEYMEELEEDTGEEIELDVVALRCDYSEHGSLREWAEDYFSDWKEDLSIDEADAEDDGLVDDEIRKYINDRGQLIEFSGGIVVSNF